jgi:hypothetical protein
MAKRNLQSKENSTTIKLAEKTKQRLDHLKEYPGESYDTIINKNLNILNICMRSPSLAARILRDIEKSKKRKELIENPDSVIRKKSPVNGSIPGNMESNVQRMRANASLK